MKQLLSKSTDSNFLDALLIQLKRTFPHVSNFELDRGEIYMDMMTIEDLKISEKIMYYVNGFASGRGEKQEDPTSTSLTFKDLKYGDVFSFTFGNDSSPNIKIESSIGPSYVDSDCNVISAEDDLRVTYDENATLQRKRFISKNSVQAIEDIEVGSIFTFKFGSNLYMKLQSPEKGYSNILSLPSNTLDKTINYSSVVARSLNDLTLEEVQEIQKVIESNKG